jgi:predicted metal-dependent hydrolase
MSTNQSMMIVGGIEALVLRKKVKNLHLNVLPPLGKVRVTAPLAMADEAVRIFLATRISWIKRQQENFKGQERQTLREYVGGESHYFFGRRYRLDIVYDDIKPKVFLKGKNKIVLVVKEKSSIIEREKLIQKWYRAELKFFLESKLSKWEDKIGVEVGSWGIRRMKTKWGSCNIKNKKVWFNIELAKKPAECIEYVIAHELTHMKVKKHNDIFIQMMDKNLPKWKSIKDELNQIILAHEDWDNK